MYCRKCPYGKEDFERSMYWYHKTVNEQGIPNDIYGDETYEDAEENAEMFLWCDKVGGKVYCFGYCADAYADTDEIHINRSKRKRRNRRERDLKFKNHIKFLAKIVHYYPPPVMPVDENGRWNFDDPVGTVYYRRTNRRNHKGSRYKFYKKYANKVVRRYKGEISNGCGYKKCSNQYWW